ncbi:MAG: hypothetical protein K1W13_05635 [Lachnospiraceae bacterium]
MKQKTTMILVGIAAALQTVAVLLAVFMTVFQSTVKQIYGCDEGVCNIKSVPTGAFAELLLPLLIYGIFLFCIAIVKDKAFARQALAIVFAALAVLFKVVTALIGMYIIMLEARTKGALAYAGYSALNNAVLKVTFLFTLAAFALFCMAAGSCLPVRAECTAASQGTRTDI